MTTQDTRKPGEVSPAVTTSRSTALGPQLSTQPGVVPSPRVNERRDSSTVSAAVLAQRGISPSDTYLRARRRALYAALNLFTAEVEVAQTRGKGVAADLRRQVFTVLAEHLDEGPAPVPFIHISNRTRVTKKRLEDILAGLLAEGWVKLVREADPDAHECRIWDIGPATERSLVLLRRPAPAFTAPRRPS